MGEDWGVRDQGRQEKEAGRGHASSVLLVPNAWEDAKVIWWLKIIHMPPLSKLRSYESTESIFWLHLAFLFCLASSESPQQPTIDRRQKTELDNEIVFWHEVVFRYERQGSLPELWPFAELTAACVWTRGAHCLRWNAAGDTPRNRGADERSFCIKPPLSLTFLL